MKHKFNIFTSLMCLLVVFTAMSCKDDEKELAGNAFEIDGSYLNQELNRKETTLTIPVKTNLRVSQWKVDYKDKWLSVFQQPDRVIISVFSNDKLEKRSATVTVTSELGNYTIKLLQYGMNDVMLGEDTQIMTKGGWSNQHQGGMDVDLTWDGDMETGYHSPFGKDTHLPVILVYELKEDEAGTLNTQEIDYIRYRNAGNPMKHVDIYYQDAQTAAASNSNSVDPSDYTFVQSFDLNGYTSEDLSFKTPIKAARILFKVTESHQADGLIGCKEMEFYHRFRNTTMEGRLLEVFTDLTCSELKEGITDEKIEELPEEVFKRIARNLKNNSYDEWEKDFRIRTYKAYSDITSWAKRLMTKRYSNLDNPTGIAVAKGDNVIVLVGDTHGNNVSLQCIWETGTEYVQTAATGDNYPLNEGVNVLTMKGPGQLFVMYNTDLSTPPQPIKIHIPLGSGTVNGFFDVDEHKTDEKYAELIRKATHKYFCVRGHDIMFYFHRLKMLDAAPNNILSAINLWDNIIGWQQELMGIDDVRPSQYNNHMFAISPEGSYMWAGDMQIGFVYTYLRNVLLYENVMSEEDHAWGPAHEIGHAHQEAINWPGSTESSNNLFSNYVIYKLGKYKSRGNGLCKLADARYRDGQAWVNLGDATCKQENTELHMRMNWQLWNYYHRCGKNPKFWQTLFGLMREEESRIPETEPGLRQLRFAMMASEAAQQDLSDFFETWGFFEPISAAVSQYGDWTYTVTEDKINEVKEFMSKYPKPQPFQYLEDRKVSEFPSSDYRYKEVGNVGYYTQFTANGGKGQSITKTPTYTKSGTTVTITDGDEAVAFEWRKGASDGELRYFSNFLKFDVPASIILYGCELYAVQADGKRIKMSQK